jgi:hypothetical protein
MMEHDADRPEDIDTDAEDHAVDECRYACLSRPWVRPRPVVEVVKAGSGYSRDKVDRRPLVVTDM